MFIHQRDLQPIALTVIDGDDPDDREMLMGSEDGFVRKYSATAYNDDGTNFTAYFIVGPIAVQDGNQPIILSELQGILDEDSNAVKYEVLVGDTPEEALKSDDGDFAGDGTFTPGMSNTHNPRLTGRYVYLKVGTTDATKSWAIEKLRARLVGRVTNKGRRREKE
jgi:hypothetical protein